MDQTTWNFIFIGITFGVYITIAIWSRVTLPPKNITPQVVVFPRLPMAWPQRADWMSAATFISIAGGIATGYGASKFLMGWTGICSADYLDGPLSSQIWQGNHPRLHW